jgi:hypothetical protein
MAERDDGVAVLGHFKFDGDVLVLEFTNADPVQCVVEPAMMRRLALAILNKLAKDTFEDVIERAQKARAASKEKPRQ